MEITQNQTYTQAPGYFKRLNVLDWLFALLLLGGALFALNRFGAYMDYYEKAILLAAVPTFAALGWHWKPVRWVMITPSGTALSSTGIFFSAFCI